MIQPNNNYSKPKKENMLLNICFNLILPIVLLRKGEDWFSNYLSNFFEVQKDSSLSASIVLIIAICFPIGYGIYDFYRRKKINFLSTLGFVSVILTGGIGLIPGATVSMFAIKEAALPAILGILTILTLKTQKPLVRLFLYNPDIIDVNKVDQALESRGTTQQFNELLIKCTWLLALTFIFSACLNYFLATYIVVTEPSIDKSAFNDEVGVMMGLSFPVISLPCMVVSGYAFWLLIKGIRKFAGFSFEDIINK